MKNNEENFPNIVTTLDGVQQQFFDEGEAISLPEEILLQEQLDTINMQLLSETNPEKRTELTRKARELEDKLDLEPENKLAV